MTRFHWLSGLFLFIFHYELLPDKCIVEGSKCDEKTFYDPYVHVRKKKNGGNIASLKSSGFMDLRFRSKAMLCINGPAVLYSDFERLEADARLTSKSDQSQDTLKSYPEGRNPGPDHGITDLGPNEEELKFTKPEIAVFNHECIPINRVPTNVFKKMKKDQGRSNPELMGDTPVLGKLVLGVFLIGNKFGHNLPELAWFKGPHFEYLKTKDKTVKDASFLMSGTNTSYCIRLPDGIMIKILAKDFKTQENAHRICRWEVTEEQKKFYSLLFQRGFDDNGVRNGEQVLQESDYEIFECPGDDSGGDRSIILDMAKTTPDPVTHANYTEFDPFSLFDPNQWTPHGYRKDTNGLSGGDERIEDRSISAGAPPNDIIPCIIEPTNPNCVETDLESTTNRDMQNVEAEGAFGGEATMFVGECLDLPVYSGCTGKNNYGHRLLELKLELFPYHVLVNTESPLGDPKTIAHLKENLNDNSTTAWKYDFLYLTAEIFSRLCMPFPKEMPFTIARIFAWYVYRAHLFGRFMGRSGRQVALPNEFAVHLSDEFENLTRKNDLWPFLIKDLERCNEVAKKENGGKGLKFQWENGDDTGKWKIPSLYEQKNRSKRKKRSEGELKRRPVRKAYEPEGKFQQQFKQSTYQEGDLFEEIEEIDAETGEKILSRKKRDYKINGSVITTKYIQPGKSLAWVKSEGVWGYVREPIQEYKTKPEINDPRADADKYLEFPENIHHCWKPKVDPVTREVVCSKTEELFFYEDAAELEFELNIAIDMWWKIWATVIGYCNKAYHSRKSETFPRLYSMKWEYFFNLTRREWYLPQDNWDLNIILSEYLTEESEIWLDSCLEGAYVNSNSHSFRPPRPLQLIKEEGPNYFIELPENLYYRFHPESSDGILK